MNKSMNYVAAAFALLSLLGMILSRQASGEPAKKIQVEVCVLDDEAKFVAGIRVLVSPYGKTDPAMQTTNRDKCLRFEIEPTTSFEIAFWHNDRLIGVQRALAGFENALVRVNYKRLSIKGQEDALLQLVQIRAYTKSLSNRSTSVPPEVVNLLKGREFNNQLNAIMYDIKKTQAQDIHKDILANVNKLQKEKR